VATVGCDGRFDLTDGIGRLSCVTGGGAMTFCSGLHELHIGPDGEQIQRESVSIVFRNALRYRVPASNDGQDQ
jgi:hypothetical protein